MTAGMDKCPFCGKQILKGAMRCPGCGKLLKTAEEQQATIEKYKKAEEARGLAKSIKTAIILVVFFILAYIFFDDIMNVIEKFTGK
ncbi:MAG: zinc-ribbon domain-containing protein [Deltaproteobacteria bacterium]|nr:zinc-ribbon domain-containing protein [Deltaproteobacteria bacterium]